MARNNAVYYSENEDDLNDIADSFFEEKLKPLEFDKNNELFLYSGKFEPEKVIEIIDKELSD